MSDLLRVIFRFLKLFKDIFDHSSSKKFGPLLDPFDFSFGPLSNTRAATLRNFLTFSVESTEFKMAASIVVWLSYFVTLTFEIHYAILFLASKNY